MDSSILCGVDGSDDARLALRTAAQLSGQLGVRLVAAHVTGVSAGELEAGHELLERILDDEGLGDMSRHVVHGLPAQSLADLADDEDAEVIVVGSRGRGPFKAALLGSVSTELIGVARRPVLVVPRGAHRARQPGVSTA